MRTRKPNVLPKYFDEIAQKIEDFEVYDDDVWLVTNPKSGTHWMQETLCCLRHGRDFEKLTSPNYRRARVLELPAIPAYKSKYENFWDHFETLERPRVMRTQLFWDQLPKALRDPNCKAKIVYVARNPKDLCLSQWYHVQMWPGKENEEITKSLDTYADLFLADRLMYMPYWNHVLDFWNRRHNPNIIFIKYEEMKKDLGKVVDRLQVFLGMDPLTKQKEEIVDYLSFEKMKKNKALQDFMHYDGKIFKSKYTHTGENADFMRKGQAGQWKTAMSPELIRRFDEWIAENTAGTGYSVEAD